MIDLIVICAVILAAMVIILWADARRRARAIEQEPPSLRWYWRDEPMRYSTTQTRYIVDEPDYQQGDRYWK